MKLSVPAAQAAGVLRQKTESLTEKVNTRQYTLQAAHSPMITAAVECLMKLKS
jgi:hypothetical protein